MKILSLVGYVTVLALSLIPLRAAQFAYGNPPDGGPGFYGYLTDEKGNFRLLRGVPFGVDEYYGSRMLGDTKNGVLYVWDASETNPSIQSYKIDKNGRPTSVFTLPYFPPAEPEYFYYVALALVSPSGKYVYIVNTYSGAGELYYFTKITILRIQEDGSITYNPQEVYDINGGIQSIDEDPSGKFIFGWIGTSNTPFGYSVAEDGSLSAIASPQLPTGAVAGTLGFGPRGKYFYEFFQINKELPQLAVFLVGKDGTLTPVPGSPFSDSQGRFNCVSPFVVDPNGKFAFALGTLASGPSAVYAFKFEGDGKLTPVAGSPFSLMQSAEVMLINPTCNFITINGSPGSWVFEVQSDGALKERANSPSVNIPQVSCFVGIK
jgi:hypothetical protein